MTRTEKLERIKKYRPSLYLKLQKNVPNLLNNPEQATPNEILIYNNLIEEEGMREKVFIKNFSF